MSSPETQTQVDRILELDRQSVIRDMGGMASYGTRFEVQRDHYSNLDSGEKRDYQAAVLQLCLLNNSEEANLGLYISTELDDLFPEDWGPRLAETIRVLIRRGLPPTYHESKSYAVLRVIRHYALDQFLPFVQVFLNSLLDSIKEEKVNLAEFNSLIYEVSRVMIILSPEQFWVQFRGIMEDRALIEILRDTVSELLQFWASEGMKEYGLEWLEKLTSEGLRSQDENQRRLVCSAVKSEAHYWQSVRGADRSVGKFILWLEEMCG